ncbi:MAG: hypothetical protein ACRCZQ_02720 [Bacteroidales bacterium]
MKKNILLSLLTLLCGAFMFYSCSTKDDVPQADETGAISFEFDANTVMSQTKAVGDSVAIPGYDLCVSPNTPMKVSIKLNGIAAPIELDVKLFGSVYKTDPYELPAGTYKVDKVIIFNPSNPSQIYYSGVMPGASFSKFVPVPSTGSYLMTEQQFTVLKYTKPTIKLYVLCAKGFNATNFGMPKFEIDRIEVTCFDLFFNVCDKNREHVVGEGMIEVYDKQGGTLLYSDAFNGGTLDQNGNPTSEGNIATLCFANDLTKDDATETYYIKITFTNTNMLSPVKVFSGVATVKDLLLFKKSPRWDPTMNAVHIFLCDGTTFCLLPRVICECSGPLWEPFESYTDINDFYSRSGWTGMAGQGDVLAVASSNHYILAVSPADADDLEKDYKWTTAQFRYVKGDNVRFNFFVKSTETPGSITSNVNFCKDCVKDYVKALVKIRLLAENGAVLKESPVYPLTLMGNEANWKLMKAFYFECKTPETQCAKVELSVALDDGCKYWTCKDGTVYRTFSFGLDNVESGAF